MIESLEIKCFLRPRFMGQEDTRTHTHTQLHFFQEGRKLPFRSSLWGRRPGNREMGRGKGGRDLLLHLPALVTVSQACRSRPGTPTPAHPLPACGEEGRQQRKGPQPAGPGAPGPPQQVSPRTHTLDAFPPAAAATRGGSARAHTHTHTHTRTSAATRSRTHASGRPCGGHGAPGGSTIGCPRVRLGLGLVRRGRDNIGNMYFSSPLPIPPTLGTIDVLSVSMRVFFKFLHICEII